MTQRPAPSASRASRAARGAAATTAATLLAAASHALVGGTITWLAVIATAVCALPLGVALAGRLGSLWRLSIAVAASQSLFHWSFVGLGTGSTDSAVAAARFTHDHHIAVGLSPNVTADSSATMWIAHLLTAVITIAVLHRGEQAILSLLRLALQALPLSRPRPVAIPAPLARRVNFAPSAPLSGILLTAGPISHRGPPAFS